MNRKAVDRAMTLVTGACALLAASLLFVVLAYLVFRGTFALSWEFFTQLPVAPGDKGGGMLNALIGSLQLVGVASAIGVPLGMLSGVYLSEFGKGRVADAVRYCGDLLNGVPSIVIGIFVYTVVVAPMKQFSWMAGSVALSLIVIPSVMRSTEDFLRMVPASLREGAWALGARNWRTIGELLLPAAARGLLTGVLIAMARIFGETAPLLFTSFSNRYVAADLGEPAASLPGMIYAYAISPYEDWRRQAWAAGMVLLLFVLLFNVLARVVAGRGGNAR